MRKLILFVIIAFMLNVCPVNAETSVIHTEAENYTSKNSNLIQTMKRTGLSNGSAMVVYNSSGDRNYELNYNVNCESAGIYNFSAGISPIGNVYYSEFEIYINNMKIDTGEENAKLVSEIQADWSLKANIYDFGAITLHSGTNSVKIVIPENRYIDNQTIFAFDYFNFEKVTAGAFEIHSVTNDNFGVFEQSSGINYKINLKRPVASAISLRYEITDFYGNIVFSDNINLSEKTISYDVRPDNIPVGWYSLKLSYNGSCVFETDFSIVADFTGRTTADTPFALDFASDWLVSNKAKIKNYAAAARLAGAKWVRERFRWNDIQSSDSSYNYLPLERAATIISGEGLNISEDFHDKAGFVSSDGTHMPKDLFTVYNMQKNAAAKMKGKVSSWEVWNEEDSDYWKGTMDDYAAFAKAAAIGISDSGSNALKSIGGLATAPTNGYYNSCISAEHMLMNDVLDYFDIYNYHMYSNAGNGEFPTAVGANTKSHREGIYSYSENMLPMWMGETGYIITSNNAPAKEELLMQARGVISVITQDLAAGADKVFYFILPPYKQGTSIHGLFTRDGIPTPAYSVYSNITYQLGEGKYKGNVADLPENAEGYLFDSGKSDVAVIWSLTDQSYKLPKNTVALDMFGSIIENNGTVTLSKNPIYIKYKATADFSEYYERKKTEAVLTERSFNEAKRIVMRQNFFDASDSSVKYLGHQVSNGMSIELEVYNFNNAEKTVELSADITKGYEISPKEAKITIPAMSKGTTTFTLCGSSDDLGYLTFKGSIDGRETTVSVSKLCAASESISKEITNFENFGNPSKWRYTSQAGVTKTVSISGQTAKFTLTPNPNASDCYMYPYFGLTQNDKKGLENATNLRFDIDIPTFYSSFRGHIFMMLNDGRKFWYPRDIVYKAGKHTYDVKLEDFILYYDGENISKNDLGKVEMLAVGFNAGVDTLPQYFTIENLGYYADEIAENVTEKVEINRINPGDLQAEAVLPESADKSELKVLINGEKCEYVLNNNNVTVDLSGLNRGCYELYIGAKKTNSPEVLRATAEFTTEEIISEETIKPITVEAEDYTSVLNSNYPFQIQDVVKDNYPELDGTSRGKFIRVWKATAAGNVDNYQVIYNVEAPESGMYKMDLFATAPDNKAIASNYVVTVNDSYCNVVPYKDYIGMMRHNKAVIKLNKGLNTVKIRLMSLRNSDSAAYFYMDKFVLTYDKTLKYTDTINVEGEEWNEASAGFKINDYNYNLSYLNRPLSGGFFAQADMYNSGYAEYEVYVPLSGEYGMDIYGTNPNEAAHSTYKMTVNGEKYSVDFKSYDNREFRHNYAQVMLKQGLNTIRFDITGKNSSGLYYFRLDNFKLNYNPQYSLSAASGKNMEKGSLNINNAVLNVGDTINLEAYGIDDEGMIVGDCEVTYTSGNESAAVIQNNVLTAVGRGKAEITAVIEKNSKAVTVTTDVNVYANTESIYVTDKNITDNILGIKLVNKNPKEKTTVNLIYAVYDGTALKNLTIKNGIVLNALRTALITFENPGIKDGNKSKIFVWNTFDDIKPMCLPIEWTAIKE